MSGIDVPALKLRMWLICMPEINIFEPTILKQNK